MSTISPGSPPEQKEKPQTEKPEHKEERPKASSVGQKRRRLSYNAPRSKVETKKTAEAQLDQLPLSEQAEHLKRIVKEKEALLEELKRKRGIAEKGFSDEEKEKVDGLIVKWREVCQEVAMEIHRRAAATDPTVTVPQLLTHFSIEPALLHYSVEDEAFK